MYVTGHNIFCALALLYDGKLVIVVSAPDPLGMWFAAL